VGLETEIRYTIEGFRRGLRVVSKFLGFYPASLFGQGSTFRDFLCVPSSGSQYDHPPDHQDRNLVPDAS
jgi:hypothetical protein